jgi:hypothetical protein
MSSDESDTESGPLQFHIIRKPWRHPSLASWLRVFDDFYQHSRVSRVRSRRQGAMPRLRIVSNKSDGSHTTVSHLPRNAYNPNQV